MTDNSRMTKSEQEEALREGFDLLNSMGATPERLKLKKAMEQLVEDYEAGNYADEPAAAPESQSQGDPNRGSAMNAAAEGVAMGGSAEIAGGFGAMMEALQGRPERSGEAYRDIRDTVEGDLEAYREREPVMSSVIETGSSMLGPAAVGSMMTRVLTPNASPVRRFTQNSVAAGAGGAAYGGLSGEEGERTSRAIMGFVQGAPFGGFFGEVGHQLLKGYRRRQAGKQGAQEGTGDIVTLNYKVDPKSGRAVTDRASKEARRQGLTDEAAMGVKMATPADRERMKEMMKIMREREANPRARIFKRPSDIAGESVVSRYNQIDALRKEVGEEIDEIALDRFRGMPVNVQVPRRNYIERLNKLGVEFESDGSLDFRDSEFRNQPDIQAMLNDAWEMLTEGGGPRDALAVHRMKRTLDGDISYGKAERGLQGRAENALQGLREDFREKLNTLDRDYSRANETYSDVMGAIEKLEDVSTVDLESPNADKGVGVLLRRLTGNQVSRTKLIDALGAMEDVGAKYGLDFEDDVIAQVIFVRDLENVFGPTTETAIIDEIARGTEQGLAGRAWDAGRRRVPELLGVDRENALRAFEELLESYD